MDFFLFQDYVGHPVTIRFTSQPQNKRQMRCRAPVVSSEPDTVQCERFYAVKSENEEGFLLLQCKNVSGIFFEGVLLEKLSDQNVHVLYKLLGMSSLSQRLHP